MGTILRILSFGTPHELPSGISHQHVNTATLGFPGALYELSTFSVQSTVKGMLTEAWLASNFAAL